MKNLHASVNKNACIGCGLCLEMCPGVFEFDPHGLSEASVASIDVTFKKNLNNAVQACPTNAISVF